MEDSWTKVCSSSAAWHLSVSLSEIQVRVFMILLTFLLVPLLDESLSSNKCVFVSSRLLSCPCDGTFAAGLSVSLFNLSCSNEFSLHSSLSPSDKDSTSVRHTSYLVQM